MYESWMQTLSPPPRPDLHILFNFNQKRAKLLIMMHFCCLLLVKIVSIYAFLVCKILFPDIGLCKFFDKFQVWLDAKAYIFLSNPSQIIGNIEVEIWSGVTTAGQTRKDRATQPLDH